MFENLQERLEGAFKTLKGQGKITEINVAETVKEIRRALVDADVNYKIAKDFTDKVREKAMGAGVLTAVSPGQMITKIIRKDFKPEEITKFRVKEDWIFDRNEGKMVVRIVGIAPVKDVYGDNGDFRGQQAMFWLYYPDIRGVLAKYEVFNPQNDVYRYTWDEFFESRQFSSRIYKVSNSLDAKFEEIYGIDARGKMESLYESQQTANEIFNKEHDMWVY